MSSPDVYGVLLVSGRMTHQENYALAFSAEPRCRLVAVADESDVPSERAALNRQLAEDLRIPYIPDLEAALSRDDVHIVSVCAEPERRGRVTVQCARAGKHVYIDKPMTCGVPDANAAVAAVHKARIHSHVFSFITTPWAQRAKQTVESGELGDLLAVHADVLFAKGPGGTASLGRPRHEHFPPKRFTFADSKRELYAMGVYAAGLVRWLSGRDVRTVYGRTANYFFQEHQGNDVEDFGFLMLALEGGLTGTITGGRIGRMSHPLGSFCGVRLIGTCGVAAVDPYHPHIEVYADEPARTPPPIHPKDPMGFWRSTQQEVGVPPKKGWIPLQKADPQCDVRYFVDCIESGQESEMSAVHGAAVIEMLMAGYLSAATHRVVSLPMSSRAQ